MRSVQCLDLWYACSATNQNDTAVARNTARIANRNTAFAYARTAYITALIAARLAKCIWPTLMSTEHRRTEMKLGRDERLLAGVRGAVEHIANRHGLTNEERTDLGVAADQSCRRALVQLGESEPLCSVTIDDFEDRVELSVEGPRRPEAKGSGAPESLIAATAEEREKEIKKRVDRVNYETNDGRARTILVKYFHKNPARS